MKERFVISNIPTKLPVPSTILYTFLLHYYQVSGIWWGVFVTLISILWIVIAVAKWNEVSIDLNTDESDNKRNLAKSKFIKKLLALTKAKQ
ncbi:MAG: hypothetical protein M9949_06195 [Candidatus Kapabacteria bacterium]|nr:hypothetical protein [Candidatus Kapabacteria bacterium]